MSARDLERLDHRPEDLEDDYTSPPQPLETAAENAAQAPDARRGTTGPGRQPLREHPELRRAAVVCHAEAGIARLREGDPRSAELELETALKVLRRSLEP